MSYEQIELHVESVRSSLKRGRFKEALENLDAFIKSVDDSEIEDIFISLSARYNKEMKDEMLGTKGGEIDQNKMIRSITSLLRLTKELAIEKATIKAGKELENLADLGSRTIGKLEQINLVLARSRILELEVMINGPTSMLLSEDIKLRVLNDIERLRDIIED